MFYLPHTGEIVVNETAPRVHNSGHHTIHSHNISQFEMLARILLDRPLERPIMHSTYVMRNLFGSTDPFAEGAYHFRNIRAVFTDDGPHLIDYYKDSQLPWRKLGHITHVRRCADIVELREEMSVLCEGITVECGEQSQVEIGIVMGSRSDWETMQQACVLLKKWNVDYETTVVSAHRTPDRLVQYAKTARDRGIKVIIAGAGGAAHLPGMLGANTTVPVIGVPIARSQSRAPHAALWSIVQMPPGIPVACMAINGAQNAAIFALQMLGHHSTIELMREEKAREVLQTSRLE